MTALVLALILFSPFAGFPRQGGAILVWAEPGLYANMLEATEAWNGQVGRFMFWASDREYANVIIAKGIVSYTTCNPSHGPYQKCQITIAPGQESWLAHELGHTLGFVDHVWAAWYGAEGYINPLVCDDPYHPAYSGYHGIMSYCSGGQFNEQDKELLKAAGY